jgi:chemotaxis protein histidine kinase CheA
MATSNHPTERFRSATDFPKTVEHLSASDVSQLYVEMRDCLIFTNRSRSQLVRRNEEHKQTVVTLRSDVARFQQLVSQLAQEKQVLTQNNQDVVAALEQELNTMTSHLDQISQAFKEVEDIGSPMGAMAFPSRFNRFWRALRALITWWREENDGVDSGALPPALSLSLNQEDRQEKPQMHSDPASVQRSLRDL